MDEMERVEVRSPQALRAWLESNHNQPQSVWLVTYKKHKPESYLSVEHVLDELLCFGWVDSVRRKLDEDRTMQLIGPRRTQRWARSYKDRADRLIKENRMHPAGLEAIAQSKTSGLWDFMDDVDALVQPEDLNTALAELPAAADNFAAYPKSYRRAVLRWIKLAKTPETRRRRLAKAAATASKNERMKNF